MPAELAGGGGVLLPVLLVLLLAALPLLLAGATAFAKIVVVLGLLRHALGTPRVPPDIVLVSLAVILTVLVMGPTALRVREAVGPPEQALASAASLGEALQRAAAPAKDFLRAHAERAELDFLQRTAARLRPAGSPPSEGLLLLAAFALTELKQAFWMGLLLFLPFLVVDLVVSSSLLAAGLGGLPSEQVALPFKLLLFVLADGWHLLLRGLLLSYT